MSDRTDLIILLGGKCKECDIIDFEMLQLDHINDDGSEDRKRHGVAQNLYAYYLDHPDQAKAKLQVLCANHNWKKRSRPKPKGSKPIIKIGDFEFDHDPSLNQEYFSFEGTANGNFAIMWKDDPERERPGPFICPCGEPNWIVLMNTLGTEYFLYCCHCDRDYRISPPLRKEIVSERVSERVKENVV